jgi:hypothetical protein
MQEGEETEVRVVMGLLKTDK